MALRVYSATRSLCDRSVCEWPVRERCREPRRPALRRSRLRLRRARSVNSARPSNGAVSLDLGLGLVSRGGSRPTCGAPPVRALNARFCTTRPQVSLKSSLVLFHSASAGEMLRAMGGIGARSGSRSPRLPPSVGTRISAGSSSPGRLRSSGTTRSCRRLGLRVRQSAAKAPSASSSSRGSSRLRSSRRSRAMLGDRYPRERVLV